MKVVVMIVLLLLGTVLAIPAGVLLLFTPLVWLDGYDPSLREVSTWIGMLVAGFLLMYWALKYLTHFLR